MKPKTPGSYLENSKRVMSGLGFLTLTFQFMIDKIRGVLLYYASVTKYEMCSYPEWRRDWPSEARQPAVHLNGMVLIPAEVFILLKDKRWARFCRPLLFRKRPY